MPGGSFRARLGGVRAGVNACLLSGAGSEGTDMVLGRGYTGVFLEGAGGGALGLAFGFRGTVCDRLEGWFVCEGQQLVALGISVRIVRGLGI